LQEIQTRLRPQFKYANVPSVPFRANNFEKEKEFEVAALSVNHICNQLEDLLKETEQVVQQTR